MASKKDLSNTTFSDLIADLELSGIQDTVACHTDTLADCTVNMPYIKDVQAALDSFDYTLAVHKWLAGFDSIIKNRTFDASSIEIYIGSELEKHPPFTKFVSSSFILQYASLINLGKMKMLHLPVDDSYNLSFPILFKDYSWNILYTKCEDSCRVLAPYKFPAIELNRSVDYSGTPGIETANSGYCYYDSSVSLYVIKNLEATLRKVYTAMADFTDYCEVKNR
jgi:hypothetical protein